MIPFVMRTVRYPVYMVHPFGWTDPDKNVYEGRRHKP